MPRPYPVLAALAVASLTTAGLASTPPEKLTRAEARGRALLAEHGLEATPQDLKIVVHKAERRLTLHGAGKVLMTCPVGLGGSPEGHKFQQGDQRTPEGDYYVCTRNPQSKFHLFLGLSYPGPQDAARGVEVGTIDVVEQRRIQAAWKRRSRPPWQTELGGMIGIHGYGAGADWTLGCVAVDDPQVETLWALARLGTPVTILP